MVMYYPHDGTPHLASRSFSEFLADLDSKYQAFLLEPEQLPNPYKNDSSFSLYQTVDDELEIGEDRNQDNDELAKSELDNAAGEDSELEITEEVERDDSNSVEESPTDDGFDLNRLLEKMQNAETIDNFFEMKERIDPWAKCSKTEKTRYALHVIDAASRIFPEGDDCTFPRLIESALGLLDEEDLPHVRHLLKHENYYVRNDMVAFVNRLPEPYCTEEMNEYIEEMNRFSRRVLAIYQKYGIPAELQEVPGEMPLLRWGGTKQELHLEMMYCYKDDPKIEEVLTKKR